MDLETKKKLLEEEFQKIIFEILELDKFCDIEHLKETPKRISKMYVDELLKGVYSDPDSMIKEFPMNNPGDSDSTLNPVIVDNIEVKSLCSHHFMPFYGKAKIVYIPDKTILGLSKFSRIVDHFSRKPQVQENLTEEICSYIFNKIKPKGVGVRIKAVHLCMTHRGAKSNGSMETFSIKTQSGVTKEDLELFIKELLLKGEL